jgi:hypothetical protein
MTATQFTYGALRLIGQIRQGQGPSPSQLADGLTTLNQMLDAWSAERTNIFNVATAAYPLTNSVGAYLTGTGQTIPRPVRIERAGILVPNPSNTAQYLRFGLRILKEREWDGIAVKISTSPVPEKLYCDAAFPNATINLLPIPTFGSGTPSQLELSTWTVLTQFPDLVTDEEFPPAYTLAIQYNLAVLISTTYLPTIGDAALARVTSTAATSLAAIRALNAALARDDSDAEVWEASEPANEPAGGPVNAMEAPQQQ